MLHWITIVIVCFIFSFIMTPVEKWVYKRISNKVVAYIVTVLIAMAILFSMFFISSLMGFGILNQAKG